MGSIPPSSGHAGALKASASGNEFCELTKLAAAKCMLELGDVY